MRDAFGGVGMMNLFIIFFVVYVSLLCIALQFAKTYRIKNYVISYLEQQQFDMKKDKNGSFFDNMDKFLDSEVYYGKNGSIDDIARNHCKNIANDDTYTVEHGVCIVQKGDEEQPYYKVFVYFVVELPFMSPVSGTPLHAQIPIGGETKVISIT